MANVFKGVAGQRGQTGVEYLGALVLVSVVIAAAGTTNSVGGYLEAQIRHAVCEIGMQTACPVVPEPRLQTEQADSGRAPREIYDGNCKPDLPGDLLRETGGDPSGNAEADQVYTNLGIVYDYLENAYGLQSFDGDDTLLRATVDYCEEAGKPFGNAFWNGEQMVFGEGFASALDVTAHELAHAITDDNSDLEYSCQSGALNEAFSDIIASNIDADDWEIGEDLPGGALRDMAHPENGHPPQPGHVDDYRVMSVDRFGDWGGVHFNSGIPNRAYFLMVQAIGRDAAEQIIFRAYTEQLDSGSGFEDLRSAALDVARELYGEDSDQYRGTDDSFAAVGLDGTWEPPEVQGC